MPAFPASFDLAALDGDNGFHLVGGPGSNRFGYSIASLGDVNGDGFDDLAINSSGQEAIWLGRQGPFAPSTVIGNEFPFQDGSAGLPDNLTEYDSWIVEIGDVNGDGFADFDHHAFYVTETYYEYEYGDSWTEIFFYDYGRIQYGGSSAATAGKRFGDRGLEDVDPSWLVPLGDVNGDGFDDVIVYVLDGSNPKVVFGSATGLPDNVNRGSAPSLAFTGASPFEINTAGDVNGDGITDVVVGVSGSGGIDHYVVYGGAGLAPGFFDLTSLDGTNGFKLTDARSVGTVGDVNGDGLDDLVVGMSGRTSSDPYYVVYGRATGPAAVDASAVDGSDGFQIVNAGTRWVGRAGDINADGLDDFLIGSDYVVFGRADVGPGGLDAVSVDGDNGFHIVASGMDTSGLIVQAAGDVNGDGVDDLVAGTPGENSVHVILGHAATAVNWVGTSARENHGGSPENDVLNGAGGNDYLRGLGGDDLLIGGGGGDLLDGGAGNDTVGFGNTINAATVDLAAGTSSGHTLGNDTLVGIENVIGTSGADDISGDGGDNRLDGGLGADRLAGRLGNDTYVVDDVGDVVVETRNAGHDTVLTSLHAYVLGADLEDLGFVGTGNLDATGNTLANVMTGGAGDDELNGGRGTDTLRGGLGNDTYVVDHPGDVVEEAADAGFDTVETTLNYTLGANVEGLLLRGTAALSGTGNALANTLTGNGADNTLSGLEGDDALLGKGGSDKLLGGDGADWLDGGTGDDNLRGGLGNDTYVVDSVTDLVSEANGDGVDTLRTSVSYTLGSGLENLIVTTSQAVTVTGNSLANVMTGSNGASTLAGLRGNDTLTGGGGADTFVFGANFGKDTITDFASADVISFQDGLFTDFTDVVMHAVQVGSDVVITYNTANTITLQGYEVGMLNSGDFLFA